MDQFKDMNWISFFFFFFPPDCEYVGICFIFSQITNQYLAFQALVVIYL